MRRETIQRQNTGYFSPFSIEITENQPNLTPFLQAPFSLENFENQIKIKKEHFSPKQRNLLYQVVKQQLQPYLKSEKLNRNVEFLKENNTFTITTGHQLNLYGGPLYLIYKIMDTVRLAEKLTEIYPENHFVPVFWTATEDHDFLEINHLHLFQNTFSWNTDQKGAVGRFSLTGISDFKQQIIEKFQNHPEFADFLNRFYEKGSLAQANTEFLMDLLEEYGVIILDADDKELKKSFAPIFQKELETSFSEKAIQETTKQLEELGYHGQAYARPVNLFYLQDNFRERIIPLENGNFEIGEKEIKRNDLFQELENNSECFSPNVVFRPLYQEFILPNLCYLGGGGEMAYWLQLKKSFQEAKIPFPLIKVRNSIQWIDKATLKKMEKLELKTTDIFSPIDELKKQFVFENAEEELDFSDLDEKMTTFLNVISNMTEKTDKGLETYAKSESTKIQNQVAGFKQKLIRHQKKKHEDAMRQIDGIYEKMFPENGLQERYHNMIPYLEKWGKEKYLQIIYEAIDPLETALILLVEEGA